MVKKLLDEKKFLELKEHLKEMNSPDIANMLDEMTEENFIIAFRLLDKDRAADVFSYMEIERQQYLIENIKVGEIENVINSLFLDDAVDFLEEMPANIVKRVLKVIPPERRSKINKLLKYPDDSAGSLMTVEFMSLKKGMTVKEALQVIRSTGEDSVSINICFITDKTRKLEGTLSLRDIVLAREDEIIEELMEKSPVTVQTVDDQEDVIKTFKKYDLDLIAVVDKEEKIVGVITVDDVIDALEEENTEDIQKMNALEPMETEYKKTGVFTLARHRIVWLFVLMISATFTGRVIGRYENVLESAVILATFIPMLMDTGGNAGAQSSSLIIRGLALGEIEKKDWYKIVFKEMRVGVLVGFGLATANFIRLAFFEKVDPMVALAVCSTLVFTVTTAKTMGGLLPVIAKTLKLDPAMMAAPLITTIVDTISLMIYFFFATKFLNLV